MKAARRFLGSEHPWRADFEAFRASAHWLEEAGLYWAIKERHERRPWWEWPTPLRDRSPEAIAEARIRYARARSYVFSSLEKQWDLLENDEPLTTEVRADTLLSRVNAFQEGREVARLLYDTVGGSAIYSQKSPFDRHLRDMQTACQHVVAQRKTLENGGSMLLGNPMAHPLV